MNAWSLLKSRIALAASLALVVVGALAVLYCCVMLAVQAATAYQTRSWVAPGSLALLSGVAGLVAAALGVWGVFWHKAAIRKAKEREEDRLRRVRDYRRDNLGVETLDGRREPYLGRDADRRVA